MNSEYRSLAGIDVHKRMLAVVIRMANDADCRYMERKFGTTVAEIDHLAAFLQSHHVTDVMMESTAHYWRPVWYGLEPHFTLHLVNRLASGELVESFVPADEQRRWRSLTRMRVDIKRKLSRVNSQVEGLLEETRMKLSSVVRDRLLLNLYLSQAQLLIEQARQLDGAIAGSMREHAAAMHRLCRMPGIDMTAAEDLLAEIGPGAVHFVTPEQMASWTGMCPGSNESAGVNHSAHTANGNRFLRRIMCQIAWAAVPAFGDEVGPTKRGMGGGAQDIEVDLARVA